MGYLAHELLAGVHVPRAVCGSRVYRGQEQELTDAGRPCGRAHRHCARAAGRHRRGSQENSRVSPRALAQSRAFSGSLLAVHALVSAPWSASARHRAATARQHCEDKQKQTKTNIKKKAHEHVFDTSSSRAVTVYGMCILILILIPSSVSNTYSVFFFFFCYKTENPPFNASTPCQAVTSLVMRFLRTRDRTGAGN